MTRLNNRSWHTSMIKTMGALTLLAGFSAVSLVGCPSGGVGDPCIPEDEYRENFAGFKLTEENIESRSFQCATRICLVNHFQGRKTCPLGQDAPKACASDAECDNGTTCVPAGVILNDCNPQSCDAAGADPNNCNADDGKNLACGSQTCDDQGQFCHCDAAACPPGYSCDGETKLCSIKVCSKSQADSIAAGENRCYVPGTDIPISVQVCSQCSAASKRDDANAVYCSCRCGVAEGDPEDPNFNFCECPEGFVCEEIRKNVGLGDKQISGKYCIRKGTTYGDETTCGTVQGEWFSQCNGTAPTTTTPDGE